MLGGGYDKGKVSGGIKGADAVGWWTLVFFPVRVGSAVCSWDLRFLCVWLVYVLSWSRILSGPLPWH